MATVVGFVDVADVVGFMLVLVPVETPVVVDFVLVALLEVPVADGFEVVEVAMLVGFVLVEVV